MMIDPRLFKLILPVAWYVIATTAVGLTVTATYVAQGFLVARILTNIFEQAPLGDSLPLILWVLGLMVLQAGFQWLREISAMATVTAVKQKLRTHLYAHLLALGPGYLERTRTGAVQSTLVDGVEGLEAYVGYYIPQIFICLIGPAAILIYLATIDGLVSLLVLISLLIVAVGPRFYERWLGERGQRHWEAYGDLNAQFLDSMQGMVTLKTFNASHSRGEELHQNSIRLYRATMSQMAISLLGTGITGLGMTAGTTLAIGAGIFGLTAGSLTPGELFVVLFLVGECLRPLSQLDLYWHAGFLGISAAEGIFKLLDSSPEVTAPAVTTGDARSDTVEKTVGKIIEKIQPALGFENVVFAYNHGERPALNDLSFRVDPGENVALVGRSGAGKTTVVSLLLRFFDPQQGRITLANQSLSEYPLDTLRQMFAVVAQDTYLFHGTVAENLRLARPEASQAELEKAARLANADEFIQGLPQGYETIIGERGLKLSGGERQRLAIARALLKDAPILILDEATSSIDAANEAAIQQALERLMQNRTTVIIAHRLSTVVNADRIVVLDRGRAVEMGQHNHLLDQQGAYARLVAAQQEVPA